MSTATTTVLSILLLETRPILVRRGLRGSGIAGQLPLALQCLDPRDLATHGADPRGVGQLPRRELKAQLEQLLVESRDTRLRVGHRISGLFLAAPGCFGATRARLPRLPLRHFRGPPSS